MSAPKVCVITGCSTGVGLHCAVLSIKAGYVTYATMRNPDKAGALKEAVAKASLDESMLKVLALDVTDQASVDKCFEEIYSKHSHVDVLINNAGFSMLGTIEMLSLEDCYKQFDTNVWGCVRTMKKVLPEMRKHRSGHVTTVTSIGGLFGTPFNDIYCSSKFAMEGMIESMAPTYRPMNVFLTLVEPGAILTDFVQNANQKSTDDPDFQKLGGAVVEYYKKIFSGTGSGAQTPEEVAAKIIDLVGQADPPLRIQTNETAGFKAKMASKYCETTGKPVMEAATKAFYGNLDMKSA